MPRNALSIRISCATPLSYSVSLSLPLGNIALCVSRFLFPPSTTTFHPLNCVCSCVCALHAILKKISNKMCFPSDKSKFVFLQRTRKIFTTFNYIYEIVLWKVYELARAHLPACDQFVHFLQCYIAVCCWVSIFFSVVIFFAYQFSLINFFSLSICMYVSSLSTYTYVYTCKICTHTWITFFNN